MLWRRWLVLAFSSLCLLLSGCAALLHPGTGDKRLGPAGKVDRSSVLPENVAIYQSANQVPGPYEQIAEVNELGEDDKEVFHLLQRRAGELGANAIIVVRVRDATFKEALNTENARRQGKAIAIFVHPERKESPPPKKKDPDEGPWA